MTPGSTPLKLGLRMAKVIVDIVIITYVKGRVGKNQIDDPRRNTTKQLQTLAFVSTITSREGVAVAMTPIKFYGIEISCTH